MTIIDNESGIDAALFDRIPIPTDDLDFFPRRFASASGTYVVRRLPLPLTRTTSEIDGAVDPDDAADAVEGPPIAFSPLVLREELRLDVDRHFPQMTASGTTISLLSKQKSWIAKVSKTGKWRYAGPIWYTDGFSAGGFAYDRVDIKVAPSFFGVGGHAIVVFTGPGGKSLTRKYPFETASFHPVQFEFDSTSDSEPVTQIGTHDHPNRPAASRPRRSRSRRCSGGRASTSARRRRAACRSAAPARTRRGATPRCTTRCRPTGRASPTRRSGRSGPSSPRCTSRAQPRRHHVRRHRAEPPPGDGDLHRLVHLRRAGRGCRARRVGQRA